MSIKRSTPRRSGRTRWYALVGIAAAVGLVTPGAAVADPIPATYVAQGPRPITGGQVENQPPNNEVSGAVQAVVTHPTDPNIIWIGTPNGGVWRTNNATAVSPTWVPLTDQMPSLSIGAVELDPTIGTNTVLVAGTGRFSSFGRTGAGRVGIYRTTNSGGTWTHLGQADLTGENISGVAPRGNVIVVSSNGSTNFGGSGQGGIFRSTNTGVDFDRLSGDGTSGLPNTGVFDLVGDPSAPNVLYAGAQTGLFRSDNTGATWTPISNQAAATINGATTNNIEFSVSPSGDVVFVGIVNNGQLAGLFRSTDQGANWTPMDIPQTNEGGTIVGLQPREKPGSQGAAHFSILADDDNANIVYLGGDRQPNNNGFPNAIGANDFSGRLFRCNAGLPATTQCTPLTHIGTASGTSAPHADSRDMDWDANGNIIEGNDGGVARRTSPEPNGTGDWFSVNGNLQIAEHHSCAYDSVGNIILCGNQDTGAPEQASAGSLGWVTLSAGDGGFVAADDSGAVSVRYSSSNSFGAGGFLRRACTAGNLCINSAPGFNVVGQGQTIQNFEVDGAGNSTLPLYTPMFMNDIDPLRLVVGSNTRLYESTDGLDNLTILVNGLAGLSRAVAYGGRSGGVDDASVLWYGDGSGQLFLRVGNGGTPAQLPAWTFGNMTDIVLDPQEWSRAFISTASQVQVTTDAGQTFTDITGNLATLAPSATIRTLEVVPVPGTSELALLAGVDGGVFMSQTQSLGLWAELGAGLPNTIPFHLEHDVGDDQLLVATMGRGSFLVDDISDVIPQADLRVTKTASPNPVVLAGEELFYTVTVTNDGPDTAFGVQLVDDLPDEVTYLENDQGCAYDPIEHQVVCDVGDLASGESFTVVIKTLVHSDTVVDEDDGTLAIINTATVVSVSVDPDMSDNVATKTTFVEEEADLSITKVCKPDDELRAGETGFCEVIIDNHGPSAARDVVLRDVNLSDGAFTFGDITASQGTCSVLNGIVTCLLGDLDAASTTSTGRVTVTIEVMANEDVDINDVATVSSSTPDPDQSNNQAQGSISVMAVADLTIDKTGPATATAGTDITYVITIENEGPSTAEGVVVEDNLPLGVTILSVVGSNGATCNAGVPGNPLLPTRCSFGNLASGDVRTMTINVHIGPDFRGPLHNDARVSSSTFDDDLENNLDTVATDVEGSADVSIVKEDSPDPVIAGNNLTYTLHVTNGGPSTADDVVVTDEIPDGTTYVEGVDLNGQEVCAFVQPNIVSCDLGTLDPGEVVTLYITVFVDPSLPSGTVLTNEASVSSTTFDPDLSDNSTSETTNVVTQAELWLDKTGELRTGNPSPVVVYTLIVHNDPGCETDAQSLPVPTCGAGGPSDAVGIQVVDRLPLDPKKVVVQFVSPGCTYVKATHTVTCTATHPLPVGEQMTFVIEVQVNGSVRLITNTATLTATTPDPVDFNNTDAVDIVVKGGTGKK